MDSEKLQAKEERSNCDCLKIKGNTAYLGIEMGKTGVTALLELRPEIEEKYQKATLRAGWYDGFEYRIISDDPKFNRNENKCNECDEIHRSLFEGKWIRPERPLEIGINWAKKHHIRSVIESRSSLYEIKVGGTTVYQGTWLDLGSFKPQAGWEPFQTISESGKITIIGETHRPVKIKNEIYF